MIDFSCNLNPYGPPEGLLKAIKLEEIITHYPKNASLHASKCLSTTFLIPEEMIGIANG